MVSILTFLNFQFIGVIRKFINQTAMAAAGTYLGTQLFGKKLCKIF